MKGELRLKIREKADATWKKLCADATQSGGRAALQRLSDERYPEFERIIEYDNRQLTQELIPAYREMVRLFRENMWLAEKETKGYFGKLLEFVDIWERWLDKSMPTEVLETLNHREEKLQPFYKHLQEIHNRLRKKLAEGDV